MSTLKSSFRDKDKPPKYKDLQTKFHGLPNDAESSSSASSNDEEDKEALLETDFDTRYGRSFRYGYICIFVNEVRISCEYGYVIDLHSFVSSQLTREALPRMDNYRNILSVRVAQRPTLDELHNATMSNKVSRVCYAANAAAIELRELCVNDAHSLMMLWIFRISL